MGISAKGENTRLPANLVKSEVRAGALREEPKKPPAKQKNNKDKSSGTGNTKTHGEGTKDELLHGARGRGTESGTIHIPGSHETPYWWGEWGGRLLI